ELLYILVADRDDTAQEASVEKYNNLIKSLGGEVESFDKWGVRKLAYPIKFKNEGFYVLVNFTAPQAAPPEIERQMRISDDVLRFITVKK
ncbi:MAG: 30S ribosomal protein S6, partial [Firmicutes bacterium]|nr:30S ribosomal protein S6 [Bacillota bacterium]